MLALALQHVGIVSGGRADKGVAIANTSPTDTDLLDRVVILKIKMEA